MEPVGYPLTRTIGPGIPIGRERGLKHRPVWVRVPPGALSVPCRTLGSCTPGWCGRGRVSCCSPGGPSAPSAVRPASADGPFVSGGTAAIPIRVRRSAGCATARPLQPGLPIRDCSATTSVTVASHALEAATSSASPATAPIPASSRTSPSRSPACAQRPASITSLHLAWSSSRAAGSTGRACSHSTARVASTSADSGWRPGSGRSSSGTPATSCVGCSTPTAAARTTGLSGWWRDS
jgi:hypothetical protein